MAYKVSCTSYSVDLLFLGNIVHSSLMQNKTLHNKLGSD